MNLVVPDASVAAKWLVWAGEPLEVEALNLLELRNQGQLEFIVPDLFWLEIGNIRNYHFDTVIYSLGQAGA